MSKQFYMRVLPLLAALGFFISVWMGVSAAMHLLVDPVRPWWGVVDIALSWWNWNIASTQLRLFRSLRAGAKGENK